MEDPVGSGSDYSDSAQKNHMMSLVLVRGTVLDGWPQISGFASLGIAAAAAETE